MHRVTMNTLLEQSARMPYHTDLRSVFRALDGRQREFTWLITDVTCIALNDSSMPDLFRIRGRSPRLVTGEELSSVIETAELQFVWGVFSGFVPSSAPDPARLAVEPFADGNEGLWSAMPRGAKRLQHPAAEVELVCWDSSATLLLSRDDDLTRRFRERFPEAVDLDEYNAARA